MIKTVLIISLVIISKLLHGQEPGEVVQFNKELNQFLNVRDFCISEEGDEAFFSIQSPYQEISQIVVIKKEQNGWSESELLLFCDDYIYLEPFLTNHGKQLFFVSDRPLHDSSTTKKDFDIWYVERETKNSQWSKPINLGSPVNTDLNEFYPSVCDNKNLYFTMESPNGFGKDDIYLSKWDGTGYSAPILLGENVNSDGYEFNAFVSRDEHFMIYTKYNVEGGQGSGDLYISKRGADGEWQKATNLGTPINTKYMEYCPFYDVENKMLYFTSRRSNIKPRKFAGVSEFQQYINGSNNGLSKIYKTVFIIE